MEVSLPIYSCLFSSLERLLPAWVMQSFHRCRPEHDGPASRQASAPKRPIEDGRGTNRNNCLPPKLATLCEQITRRELQMLVRFARKLAVEPDRVRWSCRTH